MIEVVGHEQDTHVRAPRWTPLVGSAVVHALVIVALLLRPTARVVTTVPQTRAAPVALAPVEPYNPQRTKPRPAPDVEHDTPLGPNSSRPDAPLPQEQGPTRPLTEPDGAEPVVTRPPPVPQPETADSGSQPSTASSANHRMLTARDVAERKLARGAPTSDWGPPPAVLADGGSTSSASSAALASSRSAMGRLGPEPRDGRDWRPSFPDAAGKCVDIPDLGVNEDGTPVLATVAGRVMDSDGRTPMAGAHLQVMGTTFTTFSDDQGNYRLQFDPKMLEQCRVQYVRVVAPGYKTQLLTLMIGHRVLSDDVVLRRR